MLHCEFVDDTTDFSVTWSRPPQGHKAHVEHCRIAGLCVAEAALPESVQGPLWMALYKVLDTTAEGDWLVLFSCPSGRERSDWFKSLFGVMYGGSVPPFRGRTALYARQATHALATGNVRAALALEPKAAAPATKDATKDATWRFMGKDHVVPRPREAEFGVDDLLAARPPPKRGRF